MEYQHPHIIENGKGERLVFNRLVKGPQGDYLEGESFVAPNSGPPMHVHHLQDETFTVISGRLATEIMGEGVKYHEAGATVIFKAGVPHRFWNAGTNQLHCKATVSPALNFEYFITEIFRSMKENKSERPHIFDAAWLLNRYRSEFDMLSIPSFVKKAFPIVVQLGKLLGKDKKFECAPLPYLESNTSF
jgi:quercetin dioxygenase-like cupin family protein